MAYDAIDARRRELVEEMEQEAATMRELNRAQAAVLKQLIAATGIDADSIPYPGPMRRNMPDNVVIFERHGNRLHVVDSDGDCA